MMTPTSELVQLREALAQMRQGALQAQLFSHLARQPLTLLQALPPRYGEVWFNLLDRLESSALFSEESCSFSQGDLLDSIALWLDKADAQLSKA